MNSDIPIKPGLYAILAVTALALAFDIFRPKNN